MRKFGGEQLLLVTCAVLLVGFLTRQWLHSQMDLVRNNDLALRSLADTAINLLIFACLVIVIGVHFLVQRQRRRLQEELDRARREIGDKLELEAQHRQMSMLGVLAGSLSHELGQPLSAARVGLEGLHYLRQLGRAPTPEHVETTLSRVGLSLLAMTQTIDHLRSLAGSPQMNRLETIDLAQQVQTVLNDSAQWLRYGDIHIEFTPPNEPVKAIADPAGLRLILTNLLRNAVESVTAQSDDRRLVRITVGPGATIAVQDSGPGIDPEMQTKLFEPFTSTKGGLRGIGLPLAHISAHRMGGSLSVASELGSGTTFTVHLLSPRDSHSLPVSDQV